ncbi:lipase family protein [Spirillospora sp. NPDC048911]|uniref:lipase family protein n=1 Tax=Spirillospora sp. NPDC048911 TaxID=3364527 RepID=UPI0037163146
MKLRLSLTAMAAGAVMVGASLTGVPAASAAAAAPAGCTASEADIYKPPAAVTGNPGDIIACRPTTLTYVPNAPQLHAWKVQYVTNDAKGAKVAASGVVAIPDAAWTGGGVRPTVNYAPFTHGSGPQCSLSKQMTTGFNDQFEAPNLSGFLNKGWALAATDGIGYLDGQTHFYVNGQANGRAALDIVRASRRIPDQVPGGALSAAGKVGIHGYSEGGNTSLWAAQLARSYAPELKVVGVASGGVPGDLKMVAKFLNGGPFAGFMADALVGFKFQYPEMPFDELMNDAGRQAIKDVQTNCLFGTLAAFAFQKVENFSADKLTLEQIYQLKGPGGVTWGQVIDNLKLGVDIGPLWSFAKYRIGFPTFQYRGWLEEIIPHETEDGTRAAYCKAGVNTLWNNTYAADHALGLWAAAGDVLNFLDDRFNDKPFKGNC